MKQTLTELKMSPGVFNKFLNSPLATGIRMGFEAEVVFSAGSEDYEFEQMEMDDPGVPHTIREVISFFQQSYDFSGGDRRELSERMNHDYYAWLDSLDDTDDDLAERSECESSWLRGEFRSMSEIAECYDLNEFWPHDSGDADATHFTGKFDPHYVKHMAGQFAFQMAIPSIVSSNHGGSRPDNTFVFEPDSSITPENPGDCAVEIVSPPMPINDAIKFVPKFFDWLHDNNAYTNKSTGFHVGVSLPHVGGKVDYSKLAVFLGDEYVLEQFGRLQNTMCASALKFVTNRHVSDVSSFARIVDKLRESLQNGARHIIESNLSRYTSINMKPDYIEFRSAGGDYLSKGVDQIINTMLRYAYAMSIASRPDFAKELYAKKLFKLFRLPDDNLAAIAEILSQLSPTSSYYPPLLKRPLKNINQARDNSTNNGKFEVVAPNGKRVIIAANTDYAAKQKAKSYSPDFNYPPYMVKAILRSDEPDVDLTVI